MSTSQLLRILQTLPACADDDDEICNFNTNEPEASMNRGSTCKNPFLANQEDIQVNFWNNRPELESSTFGNEFTNNHEDVTCGMPSALANTTGFCIDKHLVEYELPELMVCYKDKESDFHVKDICIDEGISDEETISSNKNNNHAFICNYGLVNGDDDDMIEASFHGTEFSKHEWLRSSKVACCYSNAELDSSNTCEEKVKLSTSIQLDDDDINQHPLQNFKDKLGKRAIVGSVVKKQKNTFDERKIEEGVTFYFDTSKTKDSNPCETLNPEYIYELPLDTESVVNQQDVASGYKVVAKDHEARYVEGDASFSMAGVISELISCSRPMPLVGDISTRSDSSANSTISFAFPTLETEYASSPVRMGKADKKRLQKQRRWRKGLLCCKF